MSPRPVPDKTNPETPAPAPKPPPTPDTTNPANVPFDSADPTDQQKTG